MRLEKNIKRKRFSRSNYMFWTKHPQKVLKDSFKPKLDESDSPRWVQLILLLEIPFLLSILFSIIIKLTIILRITKFFRDASLFYYIGNIFIVLILIEIFCTAIAEGVYLTILYYLDSGKKTRIVMVVFGVFIIIWKLIIK